MNKLLPYSLLIPFTLAMMPGGAYAKADCKAISERKCRKDISIDPTDMQECIRRGYDAPLKCRKDEGKSEGVNVQGSGGFSYGTIAAPENSPGAMGAPPSASAQTIGHSFGNQGWPGSPCILPGGINLCNLGVTPTPPNPDGNGNGPCPVKTDTTNRYGIKYSLTGGNVPLACGGAMPLSSYEVTLNRNPDRLASTEYGSYYIWLYENKGGTFKQVTGSPFKLPTLLCKVKKDPITHLEMVDPKTGKKVRDWSVDIPPPIAQMITYNASTKSMTLRLKIVESIRDDETNVDPKEKFLIIPIESGTPKLPEIPKTFMGHGADPANYSYTDCSLESDYYKDVTNSQADIVIESAIMTPCEESPILCGGTPATPSTSNSCDTVSITLGATAGASCKGKIQYAVLDRPNLIYPPNTTVATYAIEGRTAVLAATTKGSEIYMQGDTGLRLGKTAAPLVLPDGGEMTLADTTTLLMSGPATIDTSQNLISLPLGGMHKSAGGVMLEKLPAGSSFSPSSAVFPLRITVGRSIEIPEGYLVPTQPTPFVQAPADR